MIRITFGSTNEPVCRLYFFTSRRLNDLDLFSYVVGPISLACIPLLCRRCCQMLQQRLHGVKLMRMLA